VIENNVRVIYYPAGPAASGYGRVGSVHSGDERASLVWEPDFSLGQLYNKGLFLLGYAPEIISFCDSVLTGLPPERGNLHDALELMRVYEAYRGPDGRRVQIAGDR
jgi:hypothetical protein